MDTTHLKSKKKSIFMLILLTISTILTYLVLHELGHFIVANLFGAKISDLSLNLLSAHISFDRFSLTNFQNSIVDISGVLLPLVLSLSILILIGSNKFTLLSIISLLLFISGLFALLPFIIPSNNADTLNFMRYSGMNQIGVSILFGLLFMSGICFLFQKSIRKKITYLQNHFFTKYTSLETHKYVKQIIVISLLIITVLTLGNFSFLNNDAIENYKKVYSLKLNKTLTLPTEIYRINCSEKDTLIVQTKNLIADSIEVTYQDSIENKEYLVFKGNGITFHGYRRFNIIPKVGVQLLTLDGKNIKGEITIFRHK